MRVPFEQVKETIKKAFLNVGLTEEQAEECAKIHTQSSCDGVYSHGLNRVPRFCDYVKKGWVNTKSTPQLVKARGAAEHYDGGLGIGILNAEFCMKRAVALAKEHGIGMVALRNTTHWMRGGTYAWQAASEGFMGMCWINTESCMPLWGSVEPSVGNNPFCIGIPHKDGNIVLDMAMSQYAYGKLQVMRLAGKQLPYPGGFDKDGNLTSDPGAICAFCPPATGRAAAWHSCWTWRPRCSPADAPATKWTTKAAAAAPDAVKSLLRLTRICSAVKRKWRKCSRAALTACTTQNPSARAILFPIPASALSPRVPSTWQTAWKWTKAFGTKSVHWHKAE